MTKKAEKENKVHAAADLDDFQRLDPAGDIFKQIFKYSVVPTIIHDLEMNILDVNDSAIEQFGYQKPEFLEKSVFELHTEEEIEHSEEVLGKMEEEDKLRAETQFERKNGSVFDALVTPCKFILNGKPVIHVFIQDITERKKREAQLHDLNSALKDEVKKVQEHSRELEKTNSELSQFAYVASHDLQEPLRTVTNFAQLLYKKYSQEIDETADTYLNLILDATSRMRELIEGLLDYSRIGHDKKASEVNLNKTLERVKQDIDAVIKESGASLSIDRLPVIKGHETELRVLFQNLISNAIKFRREGCVPEIKLSVEEDDESWIFYVRDNGIGIKPEYHEKIFTIFSRLNDRSQFSGTGIGLAHCKKIVELHGGSIRVGSVPDQGSTFIVSLPKLQPETD